MARPKRQVMQQRRDVQLAFEARFTSKDNILASDYPRIQERSESLTELRILTIDRRLRVPDDD